MKFIHTADLHLDSKMDRMSYEKSKIRREEILRTFERLCEYANEKGVMAVIIAGDMFDTAKVSLKTKARVLHAISLYPNVDFLYLSGNHDEDNFIKDIETLPKNLKVFNDSLTSFKYENVVISGVKLTPYNSKTIYDNISLDENDVNIVTMHGQVVGYKSEEKAEVISIPRLKDKNIDYLALGHIHEHAEGKIDERGNYAYSGCLEGRGFDELGEKGFIEITVNGKELTTEFIKFSTRELVTFEYNVNDKLDFLTVKTEIINYLTKNVDLSSLVKVVVKGERKTDFEIDVEGLSARLNELFFFAKVYDKTQILLTEEDYIHDKSVRGEFVRAVWESDLSNDLKSKILSRGLNALKGEDL